jgi:hypothetical protein
MELSGLRLHPSYLNNKATPIRLIGANQIDWFRV